MPSERTSPSPSATATAIVSTWTSRPTNRTLFMTGSFACGSALCSPSTRSVTHDLRIGVGRSIVTNLRSAVRLRNATPSVFHQRHIGRVLRASCNLRGRRLTSSRGGKPRPGRCSPLWPGDLRNDGGSVSAAGPDGSEAPWDGTLRPDDRRGKEVRRVEHPGPGRLERGARARGSGEGRSAAQAGVGKGTVRGRREAPAGVGGAGFDR